MTQSKTRKGFWCSAPKEWGLAAHGVLEDKSKTHMTLETDGLAWPVVLLGRPGEALGFSGGWRGYAIDQRLWPNDSVVVNYRDSRQEGAARLAAGRPLRHYCYIFRAWVRGRGPMTTCFLSEVFSFHLRGMYHYSVTMLHHTSGLK